MTSRNIHSVDVSITGETRNARPSAREGGDAWIPPSGPRVEGVADLLNRIDFRRVRQYRLRWEWRHQDHQQHDQQEGLYTAT